VHSGDTKDDIDAVVFEQAQQRLTAGWALFHGCFNAVPGGLKTPAVRYKGRVSRSGSQVRGEIGSGRRVSQA
jgi:hypothetical protein